MPKLRTWVGTTEAAEALGVSAKFLRENRTALFKKGVHWKAKNPYAYRPTYIWHVQNCEKWQQGG